MAVDADFTSVSLLLHGNGSNNSQTVVDSSATQKAVTVYGNAKISTTQSKFGGASLYFDGDIDHLSIASSSGFAFGTNDFTIEMWFRIDSGATSGLSRAGLLAPPESQLANNFSLLLDGATQGASGIYVRLGGSFPVVGSAAAISQGEWHHVAVARSGTTLKLFLDGVEVDSDTNSSDLSAVDYKVGSLQANSGVFSDYFKGYIDDLRITKGVARYTGNFTPPTEEFYGIEDTWAVQSVIKPRGINIFSNTINRIHYQRL